MKNFVLKMLLKILTIFLFLSTLNLFSQNVTFEYILSSPLDEFIYDIIETPNDSIVFTGMISNQIKPNTRDGIIIMLDKYGNQVNSNLMHYPDKSISNNKVFINGSENIVVVSKTFDSLNTSKNVGIRLSRLDYSFNLINEAQYNFPPTYKDFYLTSYQKPDSNVIVGGAIFNQNNNVTPYLFEFTSYFDSIKAKYFEGDIGCFSNFKEMPEEQYWLIDILSNSYNMLDSSLNIISEQIVPDWITSDFGVKWDSDTSFYLVGDGLNHAGDDDHNISFIKQTHPLDTTNHIYKHWNISDTIDYPAVWGGIDFKNKDSIFIGGTRNIWVSYYNPWPSWFIILQTDSLLNIRWERFYGGDAYYTMGKIIAANDGGCIIGGTRYDYLNTTEQETDIVILKLNSEGLITNNLENRKIEMHEAIVYPNPGNNIIKIRIAAQYKQSLFQLFDINGNNIISQNLIGTQGTVNTTYIQQGTYIYRITNNDGLFETGKWAKQ